MKTTHGAAHNHIMSITQVPHPRPLGLWTLCSYEMHPGSFLSQIKINLHNHCNAEFLLSPCLYSIRIYYVNQVNTKVLVMHFLWILGR